MPRKVRGRPVAYGDAQLRALDKFLREYLMNLSGDPDVLLTDGQPFHENGEAFFSSDDLHIEFVKAHNYKVTARQTALAMAEIGVHSIQRRFENGTRLRIYTTAIPEDANCMTSSEDMAEFWRERQPGWHGDVAAEPWVQAVKQFGLHGVTRAAIRFVKANFETYSAAKGGRAVLALFNDEKAVVEEFFEQLRVEPFPDLRGYKINFWRYNYHPKSDYRSKSPSDYYEYHMDSIFDADLNAAHNKPQFMLEYFPDSNGGTPEARLKLVKQSVGLPKSDREETVLQLQHLPTKVAA